MPPRLIVLSWLAYFVGPVAIGLFDASHWRCFSTVDHLRYGLAVVGYGAIGAAFHVATRSPGGVDARDLLFAWAITVVPIAGLTAYTCS